MCCIVLSTAINSNIGHLPFAIYHKLTIVIQRIVHRCTARTLIYDCSCRNFLLGSLGFNYLRLYRIRLHRYLPCSFRQ